MDPQPAPRRVVGVFHVSARLRPGASSSDLLAHVVMTLDVDGDERASCIVRGEDAACRELRRWMRTLCSSSSPVP